MKVGDLVIRDHTRRTEIKYRITRINKIGDITLLWGYRVKYDRRQDEWVSFGQERVIFGGDYRLFTEDDYHYM